MIEEHEEACDSVAIKGDGIPFFFNLNIDYSALDGRAHSFLSACTLFNKLSPWKHTGIH